MPNWSSANIAVLGKKEDIGKLAETINSLPSLQPPVPNGFGPLWLGTFINALGGNWEDIYCRGVISPNPWEPACWSCAEPDVNEKVEIEADGTLRFSIIMAHYLEKEILAFLKTKLPSLEFRYKETDEFGNFFRRYDPDNIIDNVAYHLYDGEEHYDYDRDEKEKFVADLNHLTGLALTPQNTDEEIEETFCKWLDGLNDDDDRGWSEIEIWRDVAA